MKMRIPTNQEYDKLVALTDGANEKMHWERIFSWVNDTENEFRLVSPNRAVRGYPSARYWIDSRAEDRDMSIGFRPAVEGLTSEGELCVIGTLYMDEKPVKVPQNPTNVGDIVDYIPGAKLEIREPLDDPDYQVKGFHLGNGVFIADRVLLKNISYEDILLNELCYGQHQATTPLPNTTISKSGTGLTPYQRYQLQWMMDHGYSLTDLMNELTELQFFDPEDSDQISTPVSELFANWEADCGFGSEIWACEAEWSESEKEK